MRIALKGEVISRNTIVDVDENTVLKQHVTFNKPTQSGYILDWVFNFSDVSIKELMELASRDLVIKHRPAFKLCPKADLEPWDTKTFSVRDFLDREGGVKLSPVERATRAVAKLSNDERLALIESLESDETEETEES